MIAGRFTLDGLHSKSNRDGLRIYAYPFSIIFMHFEREEFIEEQWQESHIHQYFNQEFAFLYFSILPKIQERLIFQGTAFTNQDTGHIELLSVIPLEEWKQDLTAWRNKHLNEKFEFIYSFDAPLYRSVQAREIELEGYIKNLNCGDFREEKEQIWSMRFILLENQTQYWFDIKEEIHIDWCILVTNALKDKTLLTFIVEVASREVKAIKTSYHKFQEL